MLSRVSKLSVRIGNPLLPLVHFRGSRRNVNITAFFQHFSQSVGEGFMDTVLPGCNAGTCLGPLCNSIPELPVLLSTFLQFFPRSWARAMVRMSLWVFQTTCELMMLQYWLVACYISLEWLDRDLRQLPLLW